MNKYVKSALQKSNIAKNVTKSRIEFYKQTIVFASLLIIIIILTSQIMCVKNATSHVKNAQGRL